MKLDFDSHRTFKSFREKEQSNNNNMILKYEKFNLLQNSTQ